MRRAFKRPQGQGGALLWDMLTFERLMTNEVVHLIYWSGLGIIALIAFGAIGTAVGMAIREGNILGILFAIPVVVMGLLVVSVLVLIWRSFCELYVAVFRISEDLSVLRQSVDAERARIEKQP
ncbi:MAG: hypothetical protein JWR47_2423 [Phenylobacterium sp.]|nr:hypothetical protein [Phenylobacterium sp.]